MRAFLSALILCSALLPTASAKSLLDYLLPTDELEVITVTDTTPTGALLRPASPANPVFYMAVSMGCRDFGGIIAGDKLPPTQEVTATITKVLAKQGYLPATDAHPPSLLLVWTWGTMNIETNPTGHFSSLQINHSQLLRFLGAYKVGLVSQTAEAFPEYTLPPGLSVVSGDAQTLNGLAMDNLYVAAIAAYDYQAATRREHKLLWMT
ncbi:MAG TPA: hypothetical protein VMC06_13820, partial [Opitutaceae bacterium]|nr:hypothetical protein [Opitutaceae bacterium]